MTDIKKLIAAKNSIDSLLQIDKLNNNEKLLNFRRMLIRFIEMPCSKAPPNLLNDMRIIFIYAGNILKINPDTVYEIIGVGVNDKR